MLGVTAQQFLEDGHRAQVGRLLQEGDDLFIEDAGQRVGPPARAATDGRCLVRSFM